MDLFDLARLEGKLELLEKQNKQVTKKLNSIGRRMRKRGYNV